MSEHPSKPSEQAPTQQAPTQGGLRGRVRVPGDKSISHRSLLFGALAQGDVRITGLSDGHDVRSTRSCLEALGVHIAGEAAGQVVVHGRGLASWSVPAAPLDCGNSGTTMRLFMGALAGCAYGTELIGDASLSGRPMRRVSGPLAQLGARIDLTEAGTAPLRVRGRSAERPLRGACIELEVGSAQVKSAILLAGLSAEGWTEVVDPFGSRDHTERFLQWMLPESAWRAAPGRFSVLGGAALAGDRDIVVPGDPSSAAFWVGAAALVPGSDVEIEHVLLNPTRTAWIDVLRDMGADITVQPTDTAGRRGLEETGTLRIRYAPLHATTVTADRIPAMVDEVPIVAVLAASARGVSRIEGLTELRHKESDRLTRVVEGLERIGARAHADGDDLVVTGDEGARWRGGSVTTDGDHRLAMAFSVAALRSQTGVVLSDADCVSVSYPEFYAHRRELLGEAGP